MTVHRWCWPPTTVCGVATPFHSLRALNRLRQPTDRESDPALQTSHPARSSFANCSTVTVAVPELIRNSIYILFTVKGIMNYRQINSSRLYVGVNQS